MHRQIQLEEWLYFELFKRCCDVEDLLFNENILYKKNINNDNDNNDNNNLV